VFKNIRVCIIKRTSCPVKKNCWFLLHFWNSVMQIVSNEIVCIKCRPFTMNANCESANFRSFFNVPKDLPIEHVVVGDGDKKKKTLKYDQLRIRRSYTFRMILKWRGTTYAVLFSFENQNRRYYKCTHKERWRGYSRGNISKAVRKRVWETMLN